MRGYKSGEELNNNGEDEREDGDNGSDASSELMEGGASAVVAEEAQGLLESLSSSVGEHGELLVNKAFLPATSNVIWRFLTGRRTNQRDPALLDIVSRTADTFTVFDPTSVFCLLQLQSAHFCRALSYLGLKNVLDTCRPLQNMFKRAAADYAPKKGGNYIERHLAKVESSRNRPDSVFYGDRGLANLYGAVFDLFLAGTDTAATFLEWTTAYLAAETRWQEDIRRELLVEGSNGKVGPLLLAFLEEVMRCCGQMDLSVGHSVTRDVVFDGRLFPAGTQVFAFAGAVHADFPRGQYFDPRRFLDRNGTFRGGGDLAFFGVGRRRFIIVSRSLASIHCHPLQVSGRGIGEVRDSRLHVRPAEEVQNIQHRRRRRE